MKKINLKKVFSGRNVAFPLLILAVVFLFGQTAYALSVGEVVGNIIGFFTQAIAKILMLLVGVLMDVAAYSDFLNAPAVEKGWVMIRDLCNMFFVVVLLIIAFATILGQEEYGAKKMLPKLIQAAVLINFSKMFCGLMLDVSSVVMLTFVNAFSAIGAGNMLDILGLSTISKFSGDSALVTFSTIVSSHIFGFIYVLIATVVVASMLGMLIMRVVMIWVLIVLSPFAFFLQAVPGKGGTYAAQWWSKWTSNLISGPVIAFFLWLTFAALQANNNVSPIANSEKSVGLGVSVAYAMSTDSGLGSEAGTAAQMAKFAIAIGMLMGGMKIAQEVSGEAGAALGKGMGAISKGKALAIRGATALALGSGKLAGRGALGVVGKGANFFSEKDLVTGNRKGNAVGNLALAWQSDLQASAKKNRKATAAKYLGKIGIGDKTAAAGQDLIGSQGFQSAANAVKGGFIGSGLAIAGSAGVVPGIGLLAAGAGVGYFASRNKNARQSIIKEYEGVQEEYNQAKGADDRAQKDVTEAEKDVTNTEKDVTNTEKDIVEHKKHIDVVDEYEKNKNTVALLSKNKQGRKTNDYKTAKNFIENKNNIKDNSDSKKYLANTKNTLAQKQTILADANTTLAKNQTTLQQKRTAAAETSTTLQNKQQKFLAQDKGKYDEAVKKSNTWFHSTADKMLDRFSTPKSAMADMTKKQKDAKDWVSSVALSGKDDTLENSGKNGIYTSSGLSENWKNRFDQLNKGGGDNDVAINKLINEIKTTAKPEKLEELAKAISAYKGGGAKIDSTTFGKVEAALVNKGVDPATYNKTLRNYKTFDETKMDHKPGSGALQYDAFAKNSAKAPVDREARKDIIGVSFDKINQRAKEKGIDYKLESNAGVNQQVDGTKLKELGLVMSSLIDDEINALTKIGGDLNLKKIDGLNIAKKRLEGGNISGLSLKNSDMSPKGATDSEKRRNDYNTTQHEIMHQSGAKNEELVDASANALQEAKLYGRVPKSNPESGGQAYDEVLGKLIATMEQAGASQEAMSQAITNQISKWQKPNAERVIETEKGERDTVLDVVKRPNEEQNNNTELSGAIEKLTESLDKNKKSSSIPVVDKNMSEQQKSFFKGAFREVKMVMKKGNKRIVSPLSKMAAQENNKTRKAA